MACKCSAERVGSCRTRPVQGIEYKARGYANLQRWIDNRRGRLVTRSAWLPADELPAQDSLGWLREILGESRPEGWGPGPVKSIREHTQGGAGLRGAVFRPYEPRPPRRGAAARSARSLPLASSVDAVGRRRDVG